MSQTSIQTYAEAMDYLYSFVNWEVSRHMRYSPEVMTLARPRQVLADLGNPHEAYPIIHVTGTKGKGSVGAMCAASLEAAGLRVGLYSSPHLQDFRERFRVNNVLISEQELFDLITAVRPFVDNVPDITWFEVTTAIAFLYFAQQKVDAAVVEVGLGGRLDATNVVTPVVSVITSLSYDHTYLLGDLLAAIAREKGGIIKPGVPVVTAPQAPEALAVLTEIAAEKEAPLTVVGQDWYYTPGWSTWNRQEFTAWRAGQEPQPFCTVLPGEHQALNAALALAVLDVVRQAGLPVTTDHARTGFMRVDWPGRLEVVEHEPLMVLDAAHNAASARRLVAALTDLFPQRPLALIFGASADKDIDGMFEALLPVVDHLIVAQAVHPRALAPDDLVVKAYQMNFAGSVDKIPSVVDALDQASRLVGPEGLICVTGSLFIVGEMREVCGLPAGHVPAMQDVARHGSQSVGRSVHCAASSD